MKYDESTPKKIIIPNQPSSTATPVDDKKDSRTPVVKIESGDNDGDNFRGYGRNYPPSWTMSEKISKENAEFQKGIPFASCGKCMYYQSGHCKIVRGFISQEMVCKYFSEKYTPVMSISLVKRR